MIGSPGLVSLSLSIDKMVAASVHDWKPRSLYRQDGGRFGLWLEAKVLSITFMSLGPLLLHCTTCRVAKNFKTPGTMWAPNLSSFAHSHWYFGAHIFNEMLKTVTKNKNYLHGIPWILNARDFVWRWSNEESDSRKCFIGSKVKTKVKVKSWVKPQGSKKSDKLCPRHVGDQIL